MLDKKCIILALHFDGQSLNLSSATFHISCLTDYCHSLLSDALQLCFVMHITLVYCNPDVGIQSLNVKCSL